MSAHDGVVTYDELSGPTLDPARWNPARLPLPTGGDHLPLDPAAQVTVGGGELRVAIPRFSLSHDTFQPADSVKYLPIRDGRSRSLDGQGMNARWRRFRMNGVPATP